MDVVDSVVVCGVVWYGIGLDSVVGDELTSLPMQLVHLSVVSFDPFVLFVVIQHALRTRLPAEEVFEEVLALSSSSAAAA